MIISCNENNSLKNIENNKEVKYTKLQLFLIGYIDKNDNITNNKITFNKSSKFFKDEIVDFMKINDSIFYYHPLQLKSLNERNGKIIGEFDGSYFIPNYKKNENGISNLGDSWNISVSMEIDEKNIDKMKTFENYRIIGKNVEIKKSRYEWLLPSIKIDSYIFDREKGGRNLTFNLGYWIIKPEKIEVVK